MAGVPGQIVCNVATVIIFVFVIVVLILIAMIVMSVVRMLIFMKITLSIRTIAI